MDITWQPISLYFKNNPAEDNPRLPWYERSHNLLRVMESIRANEGDAAVQRYYWELGRRIHHDRDFMNFELSDVLRSINVSADHQVAFENPEFDEDIRSRMDKGISLSLIHI